MSGSRPKAGFFERVWADLVRVYEPDAARAWLWGLNPPLSDRRPIDLIRTGRWDEVIRAIRTKRADSFA